MKDHGKSSHIVQHGKETCCLLNISLFDVERKHHIKAQSIVFDT